MAAIQPIRHLRGNNFQQFVSVLLAADDADFRAIRGEGGDFGADGFAAGRSIVYQAYAPDHFIAHKVRRKIDDSLAKAQSLRQAGAPIRMIRFLTPLDLTFDQDLYLQNAAQAIGIGSEPWGETRLLEVLSRHPRVTEVFPETLYPSVVSALQELRAMMIHILKSQPPVVDPRFVENMFGETPVFPDVYAVQRHDSPTYPEHRAYASWRAWVYSPALALPSLEPDNEDAFIEGIQNAFVEDPTVTIDARGDDHIWAEHRADDLRFHRRWARWTRGTIAMACNIREWREGRADGYSLADVAIDVARFLTMCGCLIPGDAEAHVRLTMDPSTLRLMLDPADDIARDRLHARVRGVSSITRPFMQRSTERRYEGYTSGAYLRFNALEFTADFLAKCTRHFHGARVDTRQLTDSINDLLSANFRARSM